MWADESGKGNSEEKERRNLICFRTPQGHRAHIWGMVGSCTVVGAIVAAVYVSNKYHIK
jgi:hypothetical protein